MSPKILKNGKDESAISEMSENGGDDVIQMESPVKKEDPLNQARDELAEQVILKFFWFFLNKWSLSLENKLLLVSLNASSNPDMSKYTFFC